MNEYNKAIEDLLEKPETAINPRKDPTLGETIDSFLKSLRKATLEKIRVFFESFQNVHTLRNGEIEPVNIPEAQDLFRSLLLNNLNNLSSPPPRTTDILEESPFRSLDEIIAQKKRRLHR